MLPVPWHAIKLPLLLLIAVMLLAGAGAWWSSEMLIEAEAARLQQTQARTSAQQKLQRSNTEKQLIQQYQGTYQALIARGFVGAENRLAWLEAVQQANRDAALYGLDYSLEPRTTVSIVGNALPVGQTVMKLRMPILVEDDLTHFLDILHQRTAHLFRVRACQISCASDAPPQALNRPELEVECELLWFTVAGTGGSGL